MRAKLPAWEYIAPTTVRQDRRLRIGLTTITLEAQSDYRYATTTVLVRCDVGEDPEEQSPQLMLEAMEYRATEIRAYLAAKEPTP
mgnify:CR=1 FL=1